MNVTKFSLFKLSTASAALVFGIAPQAGAISLNLSSGSWNEPLGGSGIVYQTVASETQARWGIPSYGGGTSQKSGLGFTGVGPSTFGLGEIFQVGQLRHFNNPIVGDVPAAVNLRLSLNFDNPVATQSFNLNLQIDETMNAGSCAYFSITACADKISLSETSLSNQFSVGGIDYTLQLLGFSLTPGGVPINEFISQEGGTNQASLFAKITAAEPERVPEPASVAEIDYTLQLLGQKGGTNQASLSGKITAAEPEPVPEPATVAGTALGLLAARWAVGNKRKKA